MLPRIRRFSVLAMSSALWLGCQDPAVPSAGPGAGSPDSTASPGPSSGKTGLLKYEDRGAVLTGEYVIEDGRILMEGDIDMGPESSLSEAPPAGPLAKSAGNVRTSAKSGGSRHWENGRIPYVIEITDDRVNDIRDAIEQWNKIAPVIYVPRKSEDEDYVRFTNSVNSNSDVGCNKNGGQRIKLGAKAGKGTVLHEMGHAAGLFHEHQRSDRDSHVEIDVTHDGILESADFNKSGEAHGDFDHESLMIYSEGDERHYTQTSSGTWVRDTNGVGTAIVKTLAGQPAPQRSRTLTEGDLEALRYLYMEDRPWWADSKTSISETGTSSLIRPYTNGVTRYLMQYRKSDGRARIYVQAFLTGEITLRSTHNLLDIWNEIEFFKHGIFTSALFYDKATGRTKILDLESDGSLGDVTQDVTLSAGCERVRFFIPTGSSSTYALFYDEDEGGKVYRVRENGSLDVANPVHTFSYTGWDDIAVLPDVVCPWSKPGTDGVQVRTFVVFYDKDLGFTKIQAAETDGSLGEFKVSGLGAGWTSIAGYVREGRGQAWVRDSETGKMRVYDVKPKFAGSSPALDWPGFYKIREFTTGTDYLMATSPMEDVGRKRFWIFNKSTTQLSSYHMFPFE